MLSICTNCNAEILNMPERCPVCGRRKESHDLEIVRFSNSARDASDGLGGIDTIFPVDGTTVQFICKCPAGAFGLNSGGELVWREDWQYVSTFEIEKQELVINGVRVGIDTGAIRPEF